MVNSARPPPPIASVSGDRLPRSPLWPRDRDQQRAEAQCGRDQPEHGPDADMMHEREEGQWHERRDESADPQAMDVREARNSVGVISAA